jgi:hypothetical protein
MTVCVDAMMAGALINPARITAVEKNAVLCHVITLSASTSASKTACFQVIP